MSGCIGRRGKRKNVESGRRRATRESDRRLIATRESDRRRKAIETVAVSLSTVSGTTYIVELQIDRIQIARELLSRMIGRGRKKASAVNMGIVARILPEPSKGVRLLREDERAES